MVPASWPMSLSSSLSLSPSLSLLLLFCWYTGTSVRRGGWGGVSYHYHNIIVAQNLQITPNQYTFLNSNIFTFFRIFCSTTISTGNRTEADCDKNLFLTIKDQLCRVGRCTNLKSWRQVNTIYVAYGIWDIVFQEFDYYDYIYDYDEDYVDDYDWTPKPQQKST